MPELPEVETVVKGLKEQILQQEIVNMKVFYQPLIHAEMSEFFENVVGQKIVDVERFGKYILIVLENQKVMRIHLRMEGKFYITQMESDETLDKHVHLVFTLGNQKYLKYHDVRKFGTFELIDYQNDWHLDTKFQTLGFEPWEAGFTEAFFYQQLKKSKKMIKPFLLDQKTIVGLGNIYVDEVLFLSGIHPETLANKITKKQARVLIDNSITVLEKAIKLGGSTIRTYHNTLGIDGLFQNELNVHLQKDEQCPICGDTIIKIKVGGRGTYLCPHCQKKS